MLNRYFGEFPAGRVGWALLLLRVVTGVAMMQHGLGKIQAPFTWMNKNGPSPIPGFMQAIAAVSEFVGGAALALGFLTPLAALGIGGTMIGAILIAHRSDPWISGGGGKSWELASLYLLTSAALLLSGPGRYSLDATIFKKRVRAEH